MTIKTQGPGIVEEDYTGTWLRHWPNYPSSYEPSGTFTVTYPERYELKVTEGTSTPGYHKLKKEGALLPMNRFTQYEYDGNLSGMTSFRDTNPDNGDYTTYLYGGYDLATEGSGWYPALDYVSGLANDALDEGLATAAAATIVSGWDALTFAMELRQTKSMFNRAVKRWARLLRRGRIDKLWLEGRYGWRPLVYDIVELEKALASLNDGKKRYKERVGRGWKRTDVLPNIAYRWYADISYDIIVDIEVSSRASVVADIEPPKIDLNVVKSAWELTKLSFVVDWFVQVGSFIDSMRFLTMQTGYYAALGSWVKVTHTTANVSPSWNENKSGTIIMENETSCTYNRREPTSVPLSPSTSVNLDEFKVLDLASLVTSKRRKTWLQ